MEAPGPPVQLPPFSHPASTATRQGQNWWYIFKCLCLPYSKTFVQLLCVSHLIWSALEPTPWPRVVNEADRAETLMVWPAPEMILLSWGVFLAESRSMKPGECCVPALVECLTLLYSASAHANKCESFFNQTFGLPVCADRTNIVTHKCIPII